MCYRFRVIKSVPRAWKAVAKTVGNLRRLDGSNLPWGFDVKGEFLAVPNYLDEDAIHEDRRGYMEAIDKPVVRRYPAVANPVGGRNHCPVVVFAYFVQRRFQRGDAIHLGEAKGLSEKHLRK